MTRPFDELTDDDYVTIIWGDHEDFTPVECEKIIDHSRWDLLMESVYKHTPSDTFWRLNRRVPATENQETDPNYHFTQVKPVEKMVTAYVKVK